MRGGTIAFFRYLFALDEFLHLAQFLVAPSFTRFQHQVERPRQPRASNLYLFGNALPEQH